uniref:Putative von Willebrand factor A domain-containing protein n=1 Tax=viral metagenome TaxID=1070528 RepID=A0A6M3IGU7_9ZZZZ
MQKFDLENSNQDLIAKQTLKNAQKPTLATLLNLGKQLKTQSVILGDVSGSMNGDKLTALKTTLQAVWSPGMRALIFGSEVYEIEQTDISLLSTMGQTSMGECLQEAWGMSVSHMILITDGEPTDWSKAEILHEAERMKEVKIDTIGISEQSKYHDDYDPDFLRKLASITGGCFTDCGQPIKLSAIVQNLLLNAGSTALREGEQVKGGVIAL